MNNRVNILSTKTFNSLLLQQINTTKINLFSEDLIKINPIKFDKSELLSSSKNWVITSKNTLAILFDSISESHLKTINFYCVGDKTKKIIEHKNLNLIESALSSKALGEVIQNKHYTKTFTLIGGVIKRDELKSLLKDLHINFTDISIYDTIFTPHLFTNELDGILFFSPSAIQSFTLKNTIKNEQLFCIGQTTANEALKHSSNVHIANNQTFESVIGLVNQYYA